MSRVGKQPIELPQGVEVKDNKEDLTISVKGPKGELAMVYLPAVEFVLTEGLVEVKLADEDRRELWGLYRTLLNNMVLGVTEGFEKKLEINGVGFKAAAKGTQLIVNAGYSHPVEFNLPEGIKAEVQENVITISGNDKQLVGETAAQIRKIRKPEPYKGKGIKYLDEVIIRKAGKQAKSSE